MTKIEISVKEFAVYILRKWPIVLVCVVVFAVLSGVLGEEAYQEQSQNKRAEFEVALEEHKIAVADYEKNAIKLSELKEERDKVKTYLEDSLLMNIDPNNKQVASISIQITNDPAGSILNVNTTRQISERYFALAGDAPIKSLFSSFSLKEYDEKYLREMYSVSKGTFDLLTITAFGNKDIDAEKCVQVVYDYLLSKRELVIEGSGLIHSLSIISRNNSHVIDNSLKALQTKQKQQLETLESEIDIIENEDLIKPEAPKTPVSSASSYYIKMPIGAAIGMAVGILITSLLYVLCLPIQLPDQIQRQLNIRYLGGIQRKNTSILNLAARLAGNLRMLEKDKAIGLITANINEVLGKRRRILVTGTIPRTVAEEYVKTFEKSLKRDEVSFDYAEDVNADADSVAMLTQSDAVLFIERLNDSKLRKVNQARERVQMSGKEILGYLLV